MIKVYSFNIQRLLSLRNAILIVVSIVSSGSIAETLNITASFSPSPTQPGNNTFRNTTPNSGYCANFPDECKKYNTFSILTKIVGNPLWPIEANHDNQRKGAMIKVPGAWRKIQVQNAAGDIYDLEFRISGIGATQNFSTTGVTAITGVSGIANAHRALWQGSSWVYAPTNCGATRSGYATFSNRYYIFYWGKNATDAICSKKALFRIPGLGFNAINIAYELRTPNPLGMPGGVYDGHLNFSIGSGGDFDFGDQIQPSDSNLTINFKLDVNHILDIQFPPNSNLLSLIPEGGWQQWLQRGRRPEKLFANQSFRIWSSGTFQMRLVCQYPVGNSCGIQNEAGDLVPVETRVTLPAGIVAPGGGAVNRHLLSNSSPSIFSPSNYVDNGQAALHFEVSRDSVAQMTKHAGSRYSGNVTIVWDSEI